MESFHVNVLLKPFVYFCRIVERNDFIVRKKDARVNAFYKKKKVSISSIVQKLTWNDLTIQIQMEFSTRGELNFKRAARLNRPDI